MWPSGNEVQDFQRAPGCKSTGTKERADINFMANEVYFAVLNEKKVTKTISPRFLAGYRIRRPLEAAVLGRTQGQGDMGY